MHFCKNTEWLENTGCFSFLLLLIFVVLPTCEINQNQGQWISLVYL